MQCNAMQHHALRQDATRWENANASTKLKLTMTGCTRICTGKTVPVLREVFTHGNVVTGVDGLKPLPHRVLSDLLLDKKLDVLVKLGHEWRARGDAV